MIGGLKVKGWKKVNQQTLITRKLEYYIDNKQSRLHSKRKYKKLNVIT